VPIVFSIQDENLNRATSCLVHAGICE